MAGASFTGDFAKLQRLVDGMNALSSKHTFIRDCHRHLAEEALNQVQESFATGTDPYGHRWAPPKSRPGGQPLRDTGRLMNSFRTRVSSDGFSVESNVVYARIHNYGGPIKRGRRVNAHQADTGRFLKRSKSSTSQRINQLQGSRAVRISFSKGFTQVMPQRQFLPAPPSLGPRWTKSFAAILVLLRKQRLGY